MNSNVKRYLYSVWFEDPKLPPDDQDREWVACFVVEASTEREAQAFGDSLAKARSDRAGEPLVSSAVVPAGDNTRGLPLVVVGSQVSDEQLGW